VVVRPADTQQVAAVMALCARHGAAVVPQGGNTGLVGGGLPRREVVVSLQRLNGVEEVNPALGQVPVGAGAPEFPANIIVEGRRFHDHPPGRLAIAIRGQVRDAERLTGNRPSDGSAQSPTPSGNGAVTVSATNLDCNSAEGIHKGPCRGGEVSGRGSAIDGR
jgi:hypothetical protein